MFTDVPSGRLHIATISTRGDNAIQVDRTTMMPPPGRNFIIRLTPAGHDANTRSAAATRIATTTMSTAARRQTTRTSDVDGKY